MNRRIKKKVAKRQLIKAMQGLVDLAQEWERREEERTRRLFSYPKSNNQNFFRAAQRQKVRKIYGIF